MVDWREKLQDWRVYLRYSGVFFVFFVLFFYLSFPYGVMKELVSSQILQHTGINIRMESLSPKFLVGVKASQVSIAPPGSVRSYEFEQLGVGVSIWQLFIGRLAVQLSVSSKPKGSMDLELRFPLFSALTGKISAPSGIEVDADRFKIDDLVSLGLNQLASDATMNPLIQPVLKGIAFTGFLSGDVDLSLDIDAPASSKGKIALEIKDAVLKLSDPSLGLPDQKFTSARIVANVEGGAVKISESTKFASSDLSFEASGKIALKKPFTASELDVQLPIKLSGGLGEKFGFLLDAFSGGNAKNGEIALKLRGSFSFPQTSF